MSVSPIMTRAAWVEAPQIGQNGRLGPCNALTREVEGDGIVGAGSIVDEVTGWHVVRLRAVEEVVVLASLKIE